MKAVIVAAGRGKRLMPLTADTPKPLLQVHGVPIIEYLLRGLRASGVTDIIIVVRYLGEKIKEHYGDGNSLGLHITYVDQSEVMGTGAALLSVEDVVGDEPFMLLWGDILMDPGEYRRIREWFEERPCDLWSTLNWMADPSSGASVVAEDGHIVSITEKPAPGSAPSNWNQAGLFVVTRAMFAAMRACPLSERGEIEFTAGVQRLLDEGKEVRCMFLPRDGFWSDVGTPEVLAALNADPRVRELLR